MILGYHTLNIRVSHDFSVKCKIVSNEHMLRVVDTIFAPRYSTCPTDFGTLYAEICSVKDGEYCLSL